MTKYCQPQRTFVSLIQVRLYRQHLLKSFDSIAIDCILLLSIYCSLLIRLICIQSTDDPVLFLFVNLSGYYIILYHRDNIV